MTQPKRKSFNDLADDLPYEQAAEFLLFHDPELTKMCEEWLIEYLHEIGFHKNGSPRNKDAMKLWREDEQGFRTEDKRLIIRSSEMDASVGVTIPNFINLTNNFQIFWNKDAMIKASSNINVLNYNHFLELIMYPSCDYHDPLKVQEIFAPTAFNY